MARDNLQLNPDTLRGAGGIVIGAVSGLLTGVAAGADLFAVRNIGPNRIAVPGIRVRWAPGAAFTAAQGVVLSVSKIYGFTAIHTTGGKSIQAHHRSDITGEAVGNRISLAEISCYMALTGAISGATYPAEDTDEPEVFAVGSGSTLPAAYEDWSPIDGLPLNLPPDTGLIVNLVGAMGAGGTGLLYMGIDGFRLS